MIEAPPKNGIKKFVHQMFLDEVLSVKPLNATIQPGQVQEVRIRFAPKPEQVPCKIDIQQIQISYDLNGQRQVLGAFNLKCSCESTKTFQATSTITLQFDCAARAQQIQKTRIENATMNPFEVKTVLEGPGSRHYVVPDKLVIPPGGIEFNVVFKPLEQSVSKEDGFHKAKLIVASPEGGATVYELIGKAGAP